MVQIEQCEALFRGGHEFLGGNATVQVGVGGRDGLGDAENAKAPASGRLIVGSRRAPAAVNPDFRSHDILVALNLIWIDFAVVVAV